MAGRGAGVALSASAVYVPGYRAGRSLMLFAMHFAPSAARAEADTVRVRSLVDAGYAVATVDEWGASDAPGHVSMDFKTLRAMRRLVRYPMPQMVILDYFWLETNYYDERYGDNWAEKVEFLFGASPGLVAAMLPIDAPRARPSSMARQLRACRAEGRLSVLELTTEEELELVPLVRCTKLAGRALAALDPHRVHEEQALRVRGYAALFRPSVTGEAMRSWLEAFRAERPPHPAPVCSNPAAEASAR